MITYMLGYIGGKYAEQRKEIQRCAAEWWLAKNHRVVVLDPTFTETEFYEFMPREAERIYMRDFDKISRARNFALKHSSKNGYYNKLIVIADNDGILRDMSDYGVSTDDLLDAVYRSDADIIQPKRPFGFIKSFFETNERATTHLCLTNENQFKGTVVFVRSGIDTEYDEWYDQPYEHHKLTPGEDIDFCVRAKMQGYKVRFAENLVQLELGGSHKSTWSEDRSLQNKPWIIRNGMDKTWNKKYNGKYGRREYIKLANTPEHPLFEE